jgi:oligopeptide transport system ATP-binding protein
MDRALLRTSGLVKWYSKKTGVYPRKVTDLKAVDGVDISVDRGETLGVVGESGCGKTTLARTVMRLTKPTRGSIIFDGTDIAGLEGGRLRPFRRRMQMVFQDPYASLDPRQSVRSAITEPMGIHKIAGRSEANRMAAELISEVGLNPDHLSRFPHEFSGGQRQRIALAIALAVHPEFLVLDEPTSSLDVSVQAQMLALLRRLQKDRGLTYMFISHNLAVIREVSDRVAVMYLGRVVEVAETQRLFSNPKHPYTKALLASIPIPDPAKRQELTPLSGDVPSPINMPSGCRFRTRCSFATEKCAAVPPALTEVEKDHWVECLYDIDFRTSAVVELGAGPSPRKD